VPQQLIRCDIVVVVENPVDAETTAARKTRRERFVQVASRRTRQLLRDIQRLGNCANRSAYEYSDADVVKVFSTIDEELKTARARFQRKTERKEVEFSIE